MDAPTLAVVLTTVAHDVARYRGDPSAGDAGRRLRAARLGLVASWLRMSGGELRAAYAGALGDAHRLIAKSGLAEALLSPDETEVLDRSRRALTASPSGDALVSHVLAGMLFAGPHELLTEIDLDRVPAWFRDDFVAFTLRTPHMMRALGEVDAFCEFQRRWLALVRARLEEEPESAFWHSVAAVVMQHLNTIPLYFTEGSQREVYEHRAAIIERALTRLGYRLDHRFPVRDPARKKWRFGVLNAHFGPQTETYATIPVFKHLDRNRYEVVLLPSRTSRHPVERYCRGFADEVVVLPKDTREAVGTVRALDLDALWIGSNLTAVTNGTVILAAHRLARLQITSACLPSTTGFRNIDVFVSGSLSEPDERAAEHYSERLELVRGISHCFDIPAAAQSPAARSFSRASLGAGDGETVFVSGANFYKILPELEAAWMRVLAEVRGSVLVLYPFNPNWSRSYPVGPFTERVSAGARAHGVSPDRVKILSPMPGREDVKSLLRVCDVYLDSFPHSGITSMLDPLEVGLCTVVRDGHVMRARMGAAMMRTLGVDELIAPDVDAFVALSARLAGAPALRLGLSQRIATAMAARPNFLDPEWYGREVERILDRALEAMVLVEPAS